MFIESPRLFDDYKLGSTSGGPTFSTAIVRTKSGSEKRNINWNVGLAKYMIGSGIKLEIDIYDILNVFMCMRGQGHGFRIKDWFDYNSSKPTLAVSRTDQLLGIATAGQTQFQLIKTYSIGVSAIDLVRKILKIVSGTVVVDNDGADDTGNWTVNHNTGVITRSPALAGGEQISAGFEFDVPVRFGTDDMDQVLEWLTANEIPQIPLVELRDAA